MNEETFERRLESKDDEIRKLEEKINTFPICECITWARCGTVEDVNKTGHHPRCKLNKTTNRNKNSSFANLIKSLLIKLWIP